MDILPFEILGHLLIVAPRETLPLFCQVNRTLYELSQQEYIWKARVTREYPTLIFLKQPDESWHDHYDRIATGANARFICVTNNEINEYENNGGLSWGILTLNTSRGDHHFIATPERRRRIVALQTVGAPYLKTRFAFRLSVRQDHNEYCVLHHETRWHSHVYLPRKYRWLILQRSNVEELELVVTYLRRTISGYDNDPVIYEVPMMIDKSIHLKLLRV